MSRNIELNMKLKQTIPLNCEQKVTDMGGWARTVDSFYISSLTKTRKSAELILMYNDISWASKKAKLNLVGVDLAKSGVVTVKVNGKAYAVGKWKEV